MIKKIELNLITSYNNSKPVRTWVDITSFVEQGISINDRCDGTLDSGKLVLTVNEQVVLGNLKLYEPIPPRIPLRISEYFNEDSVDPVVSYIFMTSDNSNVPLRTSQQDDAGEVIYIYSHEINFIELTKELENKYPPNTSVRQPKNLYNSIYQRGVGWAFNQETTVRYALGETAQFYGNSLSTYNVLNNENNVIQINHISNSSVKIVTLYASDGVTPTTGIALEDYNFTVDLWLQATAPQILNARGLLWDDYRLVYPSNLGVNYYFCYGQLYIGMYFNIKYYNQAGTLIKEVNETREVLWAGDNVIRAYTNPITIPNNKVYSSNTTFTVTRLAGAAYVVVTPTYRIAGRTGTASSSYEMAMDTSGPSYGQHIGRWARTGDEVTSQENAYTTGVNKNKVAYRLQELNFNIASSAIQEAQLDEYKTLYDVANKALQEVNLKQRKKYSFSRRLTFLLQSQKAPEMTLEGYNLREILSKFCRILEVLPVLGDSDILDADEDPLTTISCVKPGENYRDYAFEGDEYVGLEKTNTLDEYYDTISARLHNLISEDDYYTESVVIQAADIDFAQITQENAGFVTAYPIYWLRELVVKGIAIPFSYTDGTGVIRGNNPKYAPDDERQTWNLTDRCFEEDIYNALPDVNANTTAGRMAGYLSKGNTISYKSGAPFIKNLGHQGPNIPQFEYPSTATTSVANLALIEACVVQAYLLHGAGGTFPDFSIAPSLNLTIADLLYVVADITFTPLNEFTYRNTTMDSRKAGKVAEYRVNAQDKVSSFKDTTYYIRAEHLKQGNIIVSPTFVYPNIAACLLTGTKIKDNYIITTRKLKIFGEYVECSYEATKNYILQNDNIKLDIEFERYAIPYDFVRREVLVYTHVLLSFSAGVLRNKYEADSGARTPETYAQYLDMVIGFATKPNQLYAQIILRYFVKTDGSAIQPDRVALLKLHLLRNKNQTSYIGKFVDNYSAGNQTWYYDGWNYAEPFRYCDALGKVRKLQVVLYRNTTVVPRLFPDATSAATSTVPLISTVETSLIETKFLQGDDKDSREGYEFNITASVESDDDDIIVFDTTRTITHKWILSNDPDSLDHNTTLGDLRTTSTNAYPNPVASGPGYTRAYTISLTPTFNATFEPGITPVALINEDRVTKEQTLVMILKSYPYTIRTDIQGQVPPSLYCTTLYAIATRYGKWENN